MPDRDAFMNGTSLDGDVVISVNLNDREGTESDEGKFVLAIMEFDEDLVTYFVVVMSAFGVCSKEALMDFGLSALGDGENIGDDRDVQKHVALEDECTRGVVAESRVGRATMCPHGGG